MIIPRPNVLNVAPEAAKRPAREVTRPNFGALEQGMGELAQGVGQVGQTVDKFRDQLAAKDAADAHTQFVKEYTDQSRGAVTESPNGDYGPVDFDKLGEPQVAPTEPGAWGPGAQQTQGFLSTRGQASVAAMTPYLDSLGEARKKIREGLSSDKAREYFDKSTEGLMLDAYREAHAHTAQQVQVAMEDSSKASLAQSLRSAAKDPTNDALAQNLIATSSAIAGKLASSPEHAKNLEDAVRSEVTQRRLDVLLERGTTSDLEVARRVFDENKHVLGEHFAHYEGALKIADQKDGAEAFASAVLERNRKPNGFIDEGKAIADWTTLPPEQRTDKAKQAFDHGLELARKQESVTKAGQFNDAASAYLERDNLNDIPPQTEQWLRKNDAEGWHKLVEWDKENRRQKKEGGGANDDQRWNYVHFETDIKEHPAKFAAMTPEEFKRQYWDKFSKADKERAGGLFAATHGEVKPDQLTSFQNRMLIERGRDAGLFPGGSDDVAKWDKKSADFYYSATKYIEQKVTDEHRRTREPVSDEFVQGVVDDLLKKGKVPGTGYTIPIIGKTILQKSTTKLESMQSGTSFEPTWTDEEKKRAAESLQRKGKPVTDANIDATLRLVNGMTPKLPRQDPGGHPPRNAKELEEAPDDYGLDLSETPPIPTSATRLKLR